MITTSQGRGWRSVMAACLAAVGVAVAAGGPSQTVAAQEVQREESVPLHEAIAKEWVSVRVFGRGFASGEAMRIDIRRTRETVLEVTIAPGTVAKPVTADVQSMALARVKSVWNGQRWEAVGSMRLTDERTKSFLVEAYCRDLGKPAPDRHHEFQILSPDETNARVLVEAGRMGTKVAINQAAVWIQREGMSREQARERFGRSLDIQQIDLALKLASRDATPVGKPDGGARVGVQVGQGGGVRVDVALGRLRRNTAPPREDQSLPPRASRANEGRGGGWLRGLLSEVKVGIDDVKAGPPDDSYEGEALRMDFFQLLIGPR